MIKMYVTLVFFLIGLVHNSCANILISDTFILLKPNTKNKQIEITNISKKNKQ